MPHRSHLKRLFAVLACCAALVATAAPQWHTLQAPHCLIVSQLSERETRAWATQFEQFTFALREVIKIDDDRFLPPLTVVLFADSGTFAPYRPTGANGKKRDVAGYFATRETWGAIALADSFSDESTRHIVLHEATHWLVSASSTQLPLWLNEGFAEVFSTFKPKKDFAVLGEPIPYHVTTLSQKSWVPLFQLMLTGTGDRLYTDSNRNPVFYAESWLFVHQLLFKDRAAGFAALNRFFDARLHGATQLGAFQTAFGKDTTVADSELEYYLHHGSFGLSKLPFPPEAKVDAPFTPAAPQTVEIALARLALTTNHEAQLRTHLDHALALDPASPAPYELLALLESQKENTEAAATAARQALDRGTRDAWMHFIVAQELWRVQSADGTLDTAAREIADHYAKAIELQPKLRAAYAAYARLAPFLPTGTQADANLLTAGYKIYPDAAELLIGIACVLHKAKNEPQAQQLITLALSRTENLTEEQRLQAESLRNEWAIQPRRERIEALIKERNYREALTECEALLQEPMPLLLHQQLEKRRDGLHFLAVRQEAQTAVQAGKPDEAIRLLEALVAQPGLNQNQLRQVREQLERLRRNQPQPTDVP
jgi:hypothetical protein